MSRGGSGLFLEICQKCPCKQSVKLKTRGTYVRIWRRAHPSWCLPDGVKSLHCSSLYGSLIIGPSYPVYIFKDELLPLGKHLVIGLLENDIR